jgi:para-nitrobenzyl esterase
VSPIVTTSYGDLEGSEVGGGILRFAGVPFARPPVGPLRFRPPEKPDPWVGTRPATTFAPVARQGPSVIEAMFGSQPEPSSEDCLYLNVWTPALDDARRPVMVWIHGGGFIMGSGSSPIYDGATFVRRGDVVLVTLNYRLAELGFSYLAHLDHDYAEAGNCGILDQVAALDWVRDNVEAFGGDPSNVTIFGESAGGMSVGTLLGTPAAQGLFHKAIAQSGAAHNVLPAKTAAETTGELMDRAGITTVAELVELPDQRLVELRTELVIAAMGDVDRVMQGGGPMLGMPWQPVHDGTVLPEAPLDAIRKGSAAAVPLLAGTTRDEWKLFGMMMDPGELTEERVVTRASNVVGDGHRFLEAYRTTRPTAGPRELFGEMATDYIFRMPAIRLAEARGDHGPDVWMYLFSWESRAFGGALGACHALELPFVFRNVDDPRMALFVGEGPPPVELAEQVQDAWLAFARHGDPGHPGLPAWPRYDREHRATMELAEPCRVVDDPRSGERRLWEHLL